MLEDDLESFVIAKEAIGRASTTIDWYGYMLRPFLAWAAEQGLREAKAIGTGHVERFLAGARKRSSPETVAGYYRALSAFFGWLAARSLVAVNPVAAIPKPSVPRRPPRRANLADLARLMDSIQPDSWVDMRDRLAIRLLFWTGVRLSELAGVDVGHIDMQAGEVSVTGKGNKSRVVPLHPSLPVQILEYLVNRPGTREPALLLGSWSSGAARGRLTGSGIRSMLIRRAAAAGVQYWNPHSYRHAAAMKLLNDGEMEIGIVAKLLGHSSPEITRRFYADWSGNSVKRAYNEAVQRLKDGL